MVKWGAIRIRPAVLARRYRAAAWVGRLRLWSGFVLFVFLTSHLSNHALGLVSLDALDAGRRAFVFVWRSPPGTLILIAALAVHVALVLYTLYRRRTLYGMAIGEMVQIALGLLIPPLIVIHLIGTRVVHELFGVNDSYEWVVLSLWVLDPWSGVQQSALTVVAWVHGCIGLHFWLRLKPWYRAAVPYLYALALLVPTVGLLGFVQAGHRIEALWQDPVWREATVAGFNVPPGVAEWAYATRDISYWGMLAFVIVLGGARGAQHVWERRRGFVNVVYPAGRRVTIRPGTTVLEASRKGAIAHASVCGGRGRCSTCRVRIIEGAESLPPPSEQEARVLRRVGAAEGVRLACQLRPEGDVAVMPLLPATAQPRDAYRRPAYLQGSEREMVIMFADLRSFTKFSEQKLPFDVVFVINRYFRYMGQAIEGAGGRVDKFIGDGVMALFGLDTGPRSGARQALDAARRMALALKALNEELAADLPEPFRFGIGLHIGHVIVGEMGYERAVTVTAIGDAVNTASRLEAETKTFECQLVVSRDVVTAAGVDVAQYPIHEIAVRGRSEALAVYVVEDATTLPTTAASA